MNYFAAVFSESGDSFANLTAMETCWETWMPMEVAALRNLRKFLIETRKGKKKIRQQLIPRKVSYGKRCQDSKRSMTEKWQDERGKDRFGQQIHLRPCWLQPYIPTVQVYITNIKQRHTVSESRAGMRSQATHRTHLSFCLGQKCIMNSKLKFQISHL